MTRRASSPLPDWLERRVVAAGLAAGDGPRACPPERAPDDAGVRSSAERYRRIVETANEGIWTVDAAGRTSFANPKLQQLLGYREPRMLVALAGIRGRRTGRRTGAGGRRPVAAHAARTAAAPQGRRRAVGAAVHQPHHDARGHHAGVLAMVTDISERHHAEARRAALEAQLRQSQKMKPSARCRCIAHDFNNVLAAILATCLLRQAPRHSTRRRDAAGADRQGRVHAAQPGAPDRGLQPSAAAGAARAAARAAAAGDAGLAAVHHAAGVELESRWAEAPCWSMPTRPAAAVLMNLCTNAWHALPGGTGRIEVGFDAVLLDTEAAARVGALAPGPMPTSGSPTAAMHGRIDAAACLRALLHHQAVGQGTGLGLAVVHASCARTVAPSR